MGLWGEFKGRGGEMIGGMAKFFWGVAVTVLAAGRVQADQLLHVDASAAPDPITRGYLHMGTARASDGHTLEVNNRYLELDGKPWLPVMGEFHYTRVPEQEWNEQLLKMKASGVDVVSTYVFWNYHEPRSGEFNWSGDRDLRHFVQLCAQDGLKVMVRIGPWSHGEVRFGGIPDWVVRSMPTRRNDPVYLHYVDRFYQQIADQLRGLWWKNDGPIIGVQIENEYNLDGPAEGAQHIATLKQMARTAGMDVPLYTVTGWDGTVFPLQEVIPVFGGYPDEPWSTSTKALPPDETYAFRFDTRVSGADLGAQTHTVSKGDADESMPHTPFLGAEFGGGVPAMYRRRSIIAPDDIAAMLPVELGSGVNLYGYYMYQGGRNLVEGTSLEESTLTGGYNDTPLVSYDFQAPLGQYGQERPVLGAIRPFHYFLQAFGDRLAPMSVHAPKIAPRSSADLQTARFSVRSQGESGFVFFNNHVRQYPMAAQKQVRFAIQLPHAELSFPHQPIDIPSDAFFIWPFHFNLDGIDLRYATAQPVTRLQHGSEVTYVFMASDGVMPEFAFDATARVIQNEGSLQRADGMAIVSGLHASLAPAITLQAANGVTVHVLIVSRGQAAQLWLGDVGGVRSLVMSPDALYIEGDAVHLSSIDNPGFRVAFYPALSADLKTSLPLQRMADDGAFAVYQAKAAPQELTVETAALRDARAVPPVRMGGAAHAAMQPMPETFSDAAAWTLTLPKDLFHGLRDVYLDIDYLGDIGRLFADTHLLDDNYGDGRVWSVGLRRFTASLDKPLTLSVLPLRADAPIYRQNPIAKTPAQSAQLLSARLRAVYGLDIEPAPSATP